MEGRLETGLRNSRPSKTQAIFSSKVGYVVVKAFMEASHRTTYPWTADDPSKLIAGILYDAVATTPLYSNSRSTATPRASSPPGLQLTVPWIKSSLARRMDFGKLRKTWWPVDDALPGPHVNTTGLEAYVMRNESHQCHRDETGWSTGFTHLPRQGEGGIEP